MICKRVNKSTIAPKIHPKVIPVIIKGRFENGYSKHDLLKFKVKPTISRSH